MRIRRENLWKFVLAFAVILFLFTKFVLPELSSYSNVTMIYTKVNNMGDDNAKKTNLNTYDNPKTALKYYKKIGRVFDNDKYVFVSSLPLSSVSVGDEYTTSSSYCNDAGQVVDISVSYNSSKIVLLEFRYDKEIVRYSALKVSYDGYF